MASIETGSPRNLNCVMMGDPLFLSYGQKNVGMWGEVSANIGVEGAFWLQPYRLQAEHFFK
jgi:hypothetical protein